MLKSSALATLSIALLVSLPNEVSSKCNDAMHKLQNEISVHVNVNTNNHHNVAPHWLREEESNMEVNNAIANKKSSKSLASESEFDTAVPLTKSSSKPHITHSSKPLTFDDIQNKDLFAAGDDRVHPHVAESELDEAETEADLDSFGEDAQTLAKNRIHLNQANNDKPKGDKDPNHLAANGDRIHHGESEIDEAEYDSLPTSMNYDNFHSNSVRRTQPRNTVFAAGNDRVGHGEFEIDEAATVNEEKKKKKRKNENELDSAISDYDNGRVQEAELDDASSSPDSALSQIKNKAKGAIDAVHNFFTQGNGHKWMSNVSDFFHPKGSESELDEAEFEEE